MLRQHGFDVLADERITLPTSISQIITARAPDGRPLKMRVRLCWRQAGERPGKGTYSAAQLRAYKGPARSSRSAVLRLQANGML